MLYEVITPSILMLELTESVLMSSLPDRRTLDDLVGMGVRIAIDDGGYMPLYRTNRMRAEDIRSELSNRTFIGKAFQEPAPWQRIETADGTVRYTGYMIQIGAPRDIPGVTRIKDDTICDS